MRGANAAVVGILGAALYNPVWTGAVYTNQDFALALTGFIAHSLESAALDCCRFDGLCRNDDAAFAVVIEVADGSLKP